MQLFSINKMFASPLVKALKVEPISSSPETSAPVAADTPDIRPQRNPGILALLNPFSGREGGSTDESGINGGESDTPQGVDELQEALDRIRSDIDVETRKLSVWHGRQQRFFQEEDPTVLASEVAVSVESVKEKITEYEGVHWHYLREAEVLIYNPVDRAQEEKVAALTQARRERLNELNEEVRTSIDEAVMQSLKRVMELTRKRDQTQASLESLKVQDTVAE